MARLAIKGITRAKATKQVASNITLSEKNHQELVLFMQERLSHGEERRNQMVDHFKVIDREFNGYIKLSDDDAKRRRDTILGKGPKTTNVNLQFTEAHVDEIVTFLMQVLFPDDGMYKAILPKDKMKIGKAFTALMNKHASELEHFRHLAKALRDMLVYNFGGNIPEWHQLKGTKVENDETQTGPKITKNAILFEGNRITAIDPYNFIWDSAVENPVDLKTKGEFFAVPERIQPYRIKKMLQHEEIFNAKDIIDQGLIQNHQTKGYYIPHEDTRFNEKVGNPHGNIDYDAVLSRGLSSNKLGASHEIVNMYVWLAPKEFGLSDSTELEVWLLTLLDGHRIVYAAPMRDANGMLPVTIGMPWEDGFTTSAKSIAEKLMPLQRFINHEINVRQEGARKAVYGTLFYDKRLFPLEDKPHIDLVAGVHAIKIPGANPDINKHIKYMNDQPATGDTVKNIDMSLDLMSKLQPANNPQQVADLDRATQYQAASTVQGSNRRSYKIGKIVDTQAFVPMRKMMANNIMAFQPSIELTTDNGEVVEVNPADLRGLNIEWAISEGMKGIDKLIVVAAYKEVITSLLQSSHQSQIDIIGLLDYYTSLLGDKTSFSDFKLRIALDGQPPEIRQQAEDLLKKAVAEQENAETPQ